jgi:hypothetical protein
MSKLINKKRNIMRNKVILSFILFMIVGLLSRCGKKHPDISEFLPQTIENGSWSIGDTPQRYIGDDLFMFIDGGAEIYHEYGFKQVVACEYQNNYEKSINAEIYEMEDFPSAYGIFSFKSSKDGKPVAIGDSAVLESYYLNFWKGHFLVTLTGFDSDSSTIEGLLTLARAINDQIKIKSSKPQLVQKLQSDDAATIYIEGTLGLFNHFPISSAGLFHVEKGIIADHGDYKILVLQYPDDGEGEKWFNHAADSLKVEFGNQQFERNENRLSFNLDENKRAFFEKYENYILGYSGPATFKPNQVFGFYKTELKQ